MFGFDKLFDLDGNGRLDGFEHSMRNGFLEELERSSSKKKSGNSSRSALGSYWDDDSDNEDSDE